MSQVVLFDEDADLAHADPWDVFWSTVPNRFLCLNEGVGVDIGFVGGEVKSNFQIRQAGGGWIFATASWVRFVLNAEDAERLAAVIADRYPKGHHPALLIRAFDADVKVTMKNRMAEIVL